MTTKGKSPGRPTIGASRRQARQVFFDQGILTRLEWEVRLARVSRSEYINRLLVSHFSALDCANSSGGGH